MAQGPMPSSDLKALRARAHDLAPTLTVGEAGVTDGVLDELDRMLAAQELIKVRFASADREVRKEALRQLVDGGEAKVVLAIGKVATYWRPGPARRPANQADAETAP